MCDFVLNLPSLYFLVSEMLGEIDTWHIVAALSVSVVVWWSKHDTKSAIVCVSGPSN